MLLTFTKYVIVLRSACVTCNYYISVFQVYDQYLNFISLEDDMFILRNQNSDNISYYGNVFNIHIKIVHCIFINDVCLL